MKNGRDKSPRLRRRELLRRAAVAGVSGLAGAAVGRQIFPTPAIAQTGTRGGGIWGMGVRREAHSLSADSDDVRIYRDVVKWMREKSVENPLDPNGWAQHWAHHSLFCATNTFSYQVHYGWFFLPWHRAYLVNLEQKIRRLAQEPAFALPYWDWTHNNRIPDWYFGDDNPLMNSTRLQEQGDALPDDFIELGPIMRAARFDHFGGRKRIPGDLQVEGTLEQSAHNNVHNWIGGEMASFDGAGNEPIFQSHHGQVDRLWDAWLAQGDGRANPDDPDWLDNEFWFYASDGLPVVTRVWDVLETEALGYTFDNLDWRPTLRPETVPQLADQPLASASELGTIAPSEEMLAKIEVVRRGNGPGRVSLNYERMSVPIHPFQHRLFFVDDRAGGAATYVGTFTILPIPDLLSGLERTITSQVEVPPAALDALLAGGRVRVIGVGVPLKGREIPTQPIPFSGVSLTVEA